METSSNWLSRFTQTTIAAAVLTAAAPAMAANELAIKTLLDQAQYWQSKGRGDLSAEAWKKLLLLDRLKTVKGGDAAARRVESAVAARSVDNRQLDEARALARGGKSDEAARAYRQVLGGKTPSGPLALEYYQTMGGSETGWEEARQGLARLSAEDPNNKQISLAYGQHLTYRGATRREGIRILSQLSRLPEFTKVATEAWRKGLIWLEASKSDVPLFQSFLTAVPGDGAIKSRLDTLTRVDPPAKPDPKVIALRNGFAALNAGDLEQASERFERLLAENANNTDALGGLGVIRLKQEKFAEAERYLSQATKGQQNLAKWGTALASARFWLAMDAGNAHREAGQRDLAIAQFTRAQRLDSTQSLPVLALADLAAEDGKLTEADRAYRQVLAKEPDSLDALRGLVNVMAQQGQIDEATRLADRLTPEMRERLGGYGQLKGEQMRRAAANATQRGDHASAVQLLEDALLWDPSSPWLRLELGRLYQAAGSLSDARAVVDGLLVSNPNLPSALYASALMSADAQDWLAGLDQLERIPPNSRNKEMMALQRRLWVRAQADRASVLARSGQVPAAKQLLRQIEPSAERDGELLLAVAQAMSDAGEDTRALAMMRTMISQNRQPDLGMMVQYSAILLKTRQDAELAAQMRHLYTQPLNEQQRNDLDKIRVAYSLRQFDTLREAGNIATAYEAIMPLVAERPDDINLQLALARLYASAKEYKDALAWYDYALQREPDNLDALVAAAGAALAVPNLDYAESAINNAAQIAPENPAVLTTLGKLYRAQGKTQLATQTFQRALTAEQSASRQLVNGPLGMRLINYTLPTAEGLGASGMHGAQSTPIIPKIAPPIGPRSMSVPGRSPAMRPISRADSTAEVQHSQVARIELPPPAPNTRSNPSASSADNAVSTAEQIVPVQYTYPSANQGTREPMVPQPTQIMPVQSLQQLPSARMTGHLQPLQLIQPNQAQTLEIVSPGALPLPPSRSSYVDPTTGNIVSNMSRNDPLVATKDTLAIRDEIEELRALRSPSVAGGGMWRSRSGDSGTSSLSDFSVPVEGKMPVGDGGHMVLRVTPVLLDAGQISKSDLNTAQRFGTNAFASSNTFTNSNSNQQAAGVAFGLGYESLRLKADIASTPIGFKVSTAVGGVSYTDRLGDMSIKLDLSRRSVTDSLLSYAGTVDDRTGTIWGGVTATGGRAELGLEDGRFGVFGYGSYHYVGGKGVVDNNRYEGGAGAYYKVAQDANMELTAGVSVTALGYDKNLRYFTLGHGGYFSPQRYFALNFPVEWSGRTGQLSYKLEGSLGIQNFRENAAAYFPGSTSLQTAWETAAATANSAAGGPAGVTWKTSYPGQTKTGMGFRLSSAVEYRLAPKWVIGGRLALDNASDYFQSSGLLYVRYSFEPNTRPVNFPPNTLRVNQL